MAIWFDATELTTWNAHQLTGIQRTTVGLLAPLMLLHRDLCLFKYDIANRSFVRVGPKDFPYVVRQAMSLHIGKIPAQDDEDGHKVSKAAAEVAEALQFMDNVSGPKKKKKSKTKTKKFRPLDILTREAPADVKEALHNYRRALKVFRRATMAWLKVRYINKAFKARPVVQWRSSAERAEPILVNAVQDTLFSKADVVISLSPSWAFANFAEEIDVTKRKVGFRFVVMIYDLIPTLFPQWVDEDITRLITTWVRRQIKNADVILAISKFQKEVIGDYIVSDNLEPTQIEVVRLGDDPVNVRSSTVHLPLPRYVPERQFVLFTSTIDIRKNHRCLYEVWRRLAAKYKLECTMLVLIGIPHFYVKELQSQIYRDPLVNSHIVILSDVNDTEMAWYLENCIFTMYPSQYEGWGLPVGESLRAGKYCIASNSSSIPEIGGDLVDYFDPIDYLGCYKLVKRAIEDKEYVAKREKLIRETYKGARWADTAKEVSEILSRVSPECDVRPGVTPRPLSDQITDEGGLPQALPKIPAPTPAVSFLAESESGLRRPPGIEPARRLRPRRP